METGGHQQLRVYQLAHLLSVKIHAMTLTLPKFEMYEEGSQIRRSSKSIKSNIVEGHGRRRHKAEYIRFLEYAYGSAIETIDHLETRQETSSLTDETLFASLHKRLTELAHSIFNFTLGVEQHHDPSRA